MEFISRVSTHAGQYGRLNITCDFGPHGCLPGTLQYILFLIQLSVTLLYYYFLCRYAFTLAIIIQCSPLKTNFHLIQIIHACSLLYHQILHSTISTFIQFQLHDHCTQDTSIVSLITMHGLLFQRRKISHPNH